MINFTAGSSLQTIRRDEATFLDLASFEFLLSEQHPVLA